MGYEDKSQEDYDFMLALILMVVLIFLMMCSIVVMV